MPFLETGSPAKSLSSKTVILSICFCLRNLSAALVFPPDIALHFSMGQRRIHEARSFSGPNVSLFQQNPICMYESLLQADLYLVASFLFKIGLRLPSNTSLFCSFSRGVLTALVFVLHPDSLMMSGACLKSGSISRYCPFWSTPTRNTRFHNRRLFTSESSNPSVPMSFAVYLDLRRLSMCLSTSSSDKHTKVVAVHCHSHIFFFLRRRADLCGMQGVTRNTMKMKQRQREHRPVNSSGHTKERLKGCSGTTSRNLLKKTSTGSFRGDRIPTITSRW